MTARDPLPLPDDAQLERLHDALEARLAGGLHPAPDALDHDGEWLAALLAAREAVRRDYPVLAPTDAQRDAAIAAALAVHVSAASGPGRDAPPTSVVRPARWHRPVAAVSAAAAALLVVAVAALPRMGSNDADVATEVAIDAGGEDAADSRLAESSSPSAYAVDASPSQKSTDTIGAIVGPASAPLVIDTVDALRELAAAYSVSAVPATDSVMSVQVAGTSGVVVVGFDCALGADEIALAEVLWQGMAGVAVLDLVTSTVRVVDLSCTELVVVP